MSIKLTNEIGKTVIADNVFAMVAGMAVYKCPGIVGLPAQKISDGIAAFFGMDNISKGIKVHTENDKISIDVYVVIEYGVKISNIAEKIIVDVKKEIEAVTGFEVEKVNVFVEGIKVDKK